MMSNPEFAAADLRIALISDLHAYDTLGSREPPPSRLWVGEPEDLPGKNPFVGLAELIASEPPLKAECLLCLGDLGDKARPIGIKYAWERLNKLKGHLQANHLLVTSGNHDCDSRYSYARYDAKGFLQSLDPPYPFPDEARNDRYWARHFAVHEEPRYRVVCLNSSAYHGNAPEEIDHGRISEATLARLRRYLQNSDSRLINILICHHHPQTHSEIGLGEADTMKSGQLLLDLLASEDGGTWIVIHGHKHHPKVTYASGPSSSAPLVISVGSFAAKLYADLASRVRNQFHILTFRFDDFELLGTVGRIYSWDWSDGIGWISAGGHSGLPAECGFGVKTEAHVLAGKVAALLSDARLPWLEFTKICREVLYLLPNDFARLKTVLGKQHNIGIAEEDGVPIEIGRRS